MVAVEVGKVLIVEDDIGVATMQRKRLETAGFQALNVPNAEQAMQVVQQGGVELIVLDHRLPGNTDGLGFYSQLKARGYDLPVIMVTGFGEEATVVKALRAGVHDFVSKSVEDLDYLPEAAKRLLAQVRREQQLVESEARLASIIGSAKDAIIIVENHRITLFNAAAEQMFACPADRALGKPLTEFIPNEFHMQSGDLADRDEGPVSFVVRTGRQGKRADGSVFPLEASTSRAEAGGRRFHTVMVRDITERDKAQRRIQEQAALLDQANDAITVRDLDGHILFWNDGAQRLYGWTEEEAIGRKARDLLYTKPTKELEVAERLSVEMGQWSGELHQVTKTGKDIVVASSWTLVRDDHGVPKAALIINTDITQRKKLEVQYLRAQRMESLGTLAGGIAHDLNNILTPILMAAELLQKEITDSAAQSIVKTLRASAERGAELVAQVLTFARGADGKRQPMLIAPLLGEICKLLRQTFPKIIDIKTEIPKDLWLISAEATQIHQVVINLSVNARDAMPNGGRLTIRGNNLFLSPQEAQANPALKPGPYVVLTVEDTGTGIPQEIINRIFDPFFTTKELGKGTGLGLATTKGIIDSHGGFINVESEVDKGTQFMVYFPTLETGQAGKKEERPRPLPSGQGELILIVDDEQSILHLCKMILESNGYRVLTTNEGSKAVDLYKQHQGEVQVVLTDMAMPRMDGQAVIRALREINPQVRIVANSGFFPDSSRSQSSVQRVVGADKFLVKPFTAISLLTTLHDLLKAAPQDLSKAAGCS